MVTRWTDLLKGLEQQKASAHAEIDPILKRRKESVYLTDLQALYIAANLSPHDQAALIDYCLENYNNRDALEML